MDRPTDKIAKLPLAAKVQDNDKLCNLSAFDKPRTAFILRCHAYAFATEAAQSFEEQQDAMRELLAATREYSETIRRIRTRAETAQKVARIECHACGFVHRRDNPSCPGASRMG